MAKRNPILIGRAEPINAVLPAIRNMLAAEGFYIGTDTAKPGYQVPLVVLHGRVYSMKIDEELNPERFMETVEIHGPYRADAAGEPT